MTCRDLIIYQVVYFKIKTVVNNSALLKNRYDIDIFKIGTNPEPKMYKLNKTGSNFRYFSLLFH